jgi:hypothetical protein
VPIYRTVEAAQIPWRPLGELFVARGLITEEELEQALAEQAATKQRLGEILVGRHLISSPELTQALMEQLGREVAKEEGFGSGLWAEIRRRQARPEDAPELSLVVEDLDLFSSEPGDAVEEPALHDGIADELERDIEELKSELGVVPPESSPVHEELGDATNIELERARQELRERSATIETLTSELESMRRSLEAREQTFAEEIDSWQQARREANALREDLSRRDSRLVELEAEVASLMLSREQEDAGQSARVEETEHDLVEARQELQAHAGRITELEGILGERDGRIEELQSILADSEQVVAEGAGVREALQKAEHELEVARNERETRRAELEQARADLDHARATVLDVEQRLAVASGRAVELDGQVSVLGDRLIALGASLAAERNALQGAEGRREDACLERDAARAELEQTRAGLVELESLLLEERAAHSLARRQSEQTLARLESTETKLHAAQDREAELDSQIERLAKEKAELSAAAIKEREAADLSRAEIASRLAEEAASHTETHLVLAQALDELLSIRAEAGPGCDEAPHSLEGYLCFAPRKDGYRLLACTGPPPGLGEAYELDGMEHIITRVGRSPLPFDRRRCVYLQSVS